MPTSAIRIPHAERNRNKNKSFRGTEMEAIRVYLELFGGTETTGIWNQPCLVTTHILPYQLSAK